MRSLRILSQINKSEKYHHWYTHENWSTPIGETILPGKSPPKKTMEPATDYFKELYLTFEIVS